MTYFIKSFPLLLLLMFTVTSHSLSQSAPVFKQPAHVFPQTLSWWDSIYMYPSFKPGLITYFTNFTPQQHVLLNYNLYYGQMELITTGGDTAQVKPLKTIKSVQVGSDVYYLEEKKGYLRVLIAGDVTLAAHTFFHLADMQYVSGDISLQGGESPGTDVRGRPSVFDKLYVLGSAYSFLDADQKSFTPSRAYLYRIFPEFKGAIDDYLRTRSINFFVEKDLIEITTFCNQLRRIPDDTANRMVVRAHKRVSVTLRDSVYRFPLFQDGVIVFQDGRQRSYTAALNYNLFTGDMEIIDGGDTTKVRNSSTIARVNLNGTTYFKKSGDHLEVIQRGPVSLCVARSIAMIHLQVLQATSKYTPTDKYDPSSTDADVVKYDRLFARQNKFYLLDSRGQVFEPTVPVFYRAFPSRKKEIDEFIASHHPNFQKEDDLKHFLSFLTISPSN